MGGSSITPGNAEEMASLRAEHGGAIGILMILYAIQLYLGPDEKINKEVIIWIDNAEVLRRARLPTIGNKMKDHMVLDYDMWRLQNNIQRKK